MHGATSLPPAHSSSRISLAEHSAAHSKDRVFFFADYQGTRLNQGIDAGRISVPSLQDRTGDLSDVAGSLTGIVNGRYWADLLSQKLGYPVYSGAPYYISGWPTSWQR